MRIVFLLEEPSVKYALDSLLPRILPEGVEFLTIPHNGKQALERSLVHKLRGWNEPDVRFVVLEDQDTKNCIEVKARLSAICEGSGKPCLVRIACQEMEAWYFGDPEAVTTAYPDSGFDKLTRKKKYRIPDQIPSPKEEFYRLIPEHQQISGAQRIAPHMRVERNTSHSLQVFVDGVRRLANQPCT